MKKLFVATMIGLALFAGCKEKNSNQKILGNWIQVSSNAAEREYVEVYINDSTFWTYNRTWGFLNEDQFKYTVSKDVLTLVNREEAKGNKAKIQYFLPDSFKLDYGNQVFTYIRIADDVNTLDKIKEIGYEPYRKGYDYRRASYLDRNLP